MLERSLVAGEELLVPHVGIDSPSNGKAVQLFVEFRDSGCANSQDYTSRGAD